MWSKLTGFILRKKWVFLTIILFLTAFMGYHATDVKLSYEMPEVVPQTDSDFVFYQKFKARFGEDGDLLIVGFDGLDIFHKKTFNLWLTLADDLKEISGVKSVASVPTSLVLYKDTATRKFAMRPLVTGPLKNQQEADSVKEVYMGLPFYEGLFYNDSTHATMMAIKLENNIMRSKSRVYLIDSIYQLTEAFANQTRSTLHYSGLPYIRTVFANKIQKELNIFLGLSVLITSIVLLLFFRSFYTVIFPLILITIIIIWTLGLIVLLGYKLTLLTGLIPPLIVIIAVPNFIYFLNRYHNEYKKYGNKIVAIIRMVENIARVIFMNNATTAIGFGVLFFVDSPILKEFGVVAFIMICLIYIVTLILMPIIFSFIPEPTTKQTRYLNNRLMMKFISIVDNLSHNHRKLVYSITVVVSIFAIVGITKLHAIGYIMDDIPQGDKLSADLEFFEKNFTGIMPFEVMIDTHKKNGLLNLSALAKIQQFQDSLKAFPGVAGSLSIPDVAMYARQAFYNGSTARYSLPTRNEQVFLLPYFKGLNFSNSGGSSSLNYNMVDSTFQVARISARMADVGSVQLEKMIHKLHKDADSIFGDNISYHFSGYSLIFLKGNHYLISNLASSLTMAIILITVVIAFLFRSVRLVLITLLPNILALLITGALMGFMDIPLKPSTVLVFSIAFGIAVDASFHFLVNYRQDLKMHNWDISKTVTICLRETGASIIYTSLVLFFGFGIFCFSNFGSTVALGALSSLTILCAMFTNIILIPALLISFDKKSKRERR